MQAGIWRVGTCGIAMLLMGAAAPAAECPSLVKNALRPVTQDSPLSWAAELTLKAGQNRYAGDRTSFNNEMILGALEYQLAPEHRMYVEGGAKFWNRDNDENAGETLRYGASASGGQERLRSGSETRHYGLREAFYEFAPPAYLLKLGLQEMSAGDPLLLDERVLGAYGHWDVNAFRARGGVGTVDRDFARMGKFCGSRHMYAPVDGYYRDELSNDLFKNNLAFLTLSWLPGRPAADAGAEDEFAPMDAPPAVLFALDEMGATVFNQFGDGLSNSATYAAVFARAALPFGIALSLEALAQFEDGTTRPAYLVKANKSFDWNAVGATVLDAGYLAAPGNDEAMRFAPDFVNLFLGEMLKLDAVHAPLYYGSIFHSVPLAWPVYGGVAYVAQVEDDNARELDVEIGVSPRVGWQVAGIPVFDHTTLRLIYSTAEADGLDGRLDSWRAEIRWAL